MARRGAAKAATSRDTRAKFLPISPNRKAANAQNVSE